jgi:hypothetical protein
LKYYTTIWKLDLLLSSGVKRGKDPIVSDAGGRNASRMTDNMMIEADPASETLYNS